jgi:hypothetical protein
VRRRPSPHLSLPLRRSQILRPPPPSIPPSSITYSNPRSPLPEPVARARGRGCPGAVGIMGLWIHRYPSLAPAGSVRRHHLFDLHSLVPSHIDLSRGSDGGGPRELAPRSPHSSDPHALPQASMAAQQPRARQINLLGAGDGLSRHPSLPLLSGPPAQPPVMRCIC